MRDSTSATGCAQINPSSPINALSIYIKGMKITACLSIEASNADMAAPMVCRLDCITPKAPISQAVVISILVKCMLELKDSGFERNMFTIGPAKIKQRVDTIRQQSEPNNREYRILLMSLSFFFAP